MIGVPVRTLDDLGRALEQFGNRVRATWTGEQPIELVFKAYNPKRSRAQNALYWVWLTELARVFSAGGVKHSKEDMHDLMRWKHLGTETKVVAGEEITRLPSTTSLQRPEMAEYMGKVEAWAAEMGVYLPMPEDNEYMQYREAMQ